MPEMVSATRGRPQSFQRQSREESRLDFSISENKRSSDGACEGAHLGGDASVAPTSATSAVSGPGVMPLQKVTLFRKTMDGDDYLICRLSLGKDGGYDLLPFKSFYGPSY